MALLLAPTSNGQSTDPNVPGIFPQQRAPGAAFGFTPGMTKAQVIASVGPKSVTKDRGDLMWLSSAPISDGDFSTYVVFVSATTGLAKFIAISNRFVICPDSEGLEAKYNQIRRAMEDKYGTSTALLKPEATWNFRELFSSWMSEDKSDISLQVLRVSRDNGFVTIYYEYPNFADWVREHSPSFRFHLTSYPRETNAGAYTQPSFVKSVSW